MSALVLVGQKSLGQIVPIGLAASAQLKLAVSLVLPKIQAQLDGLLSLSVSLSITPPSLSANLSLLVDLTASLTASLAIGLPGIDFQVAAIASLIAKINVDLGSVTALAAFQLSLDIAFANAGVDVYSYDGTVADFGSSATTAFNPGLPGGSSGPSRINALVLVAESDAVWTAMNAVFATK